MTDVLLSVQALNKRFGAVQASKNFSMDITCGELHALIGPNGAGKTTLFNLVTGFLKPESGEIQFNGHMITRLKSHQICKLGITRTFQIVKPFAHLTTLENVAVGSFNTTKNLKEVEEKSWEILQFVGLDRKALDPAHSLTLPDRKRLELARCLALKPEIIICDEIFSGLSMSEIASMVPLIERLQMDGITLIMIEHRLRELFRVTDRVMVLNFGKKLIEGHPKTIMANEDVKTAYFGSQDVEEVMDHA